MRANDLLQPKQLSLTGLVFLILTCSLSAAADDGQSARQWLQRMIHAVNHLTYHGTFIYLHDNQLETMKIVHTIKNGKLQERLTSLNGAPREVIRDHDSVTCIMPESQQVSVDKRPLSRQFLALLPNDLQQLTKYYTFRWLGKGRVAGRETKVVAIIPKDGLRYGYRFFLDNQSALPLKSDLMNEEGKAVEQTMFTHLEIGNAEVIHNPKMIAESQDRLEISEISENTQPIPLDEGIWTFHNLPEGFSLSMRNKVPDPDGERSIEQYVLTDGLASLSVFVESAGQGEALNGVSRLGAINAWGGELEGYQVTIVGEVPTETLLGTVSAMKLRHD